MGRTLNKGKIMGYDEDYSDIDDSEELSYELLDQREDITYSDKSKEDWQESEKLVDIYKKQFLENPSKNDILESKKAIEKLLDMFSPLFKKYLKLIKTGQINFSDLEEKLFVCCFLDDKNLINALKRKKQKTEQKSDIYIKFNFIKETYGGLDTLDIENDLRYLFMVMAKRYKQMGKSFCGFIYNGYKFEVSRHIKNFIKNPLNIKYKVVLYEDFGNMDGDDFITENNYEDTFYVDSMGIPDMTWISGKNCSDLFIDLSPIDRKILIKYYLEMWNDRQISEVFGMHTNIVNERRRSAVNQIAIKYGIDITQIKRNRRSGKKAILPI